MTRTSTNSDLKVLIPDGESHFALPVIDCLGHTRGTLVHVVSRHRNARARFSRYCASFEVAREDDAMLEAVESRTRRNEARVILPVSEAGIRFVNRHRNRLLKHARVAATPSPQSLEIASDKWLLAGFLSLHEFPHPPTVLWLDEERSRRAVSELEFPALIKPMRESGGRGIRDFESATQFFEHAARHPELAGACIVQTVIPGIDIDCSVLCRDGKVFAHTIQQPLEHPGNAFAPATGIRTLEHPETLEVVKQVMAALEWDGIAHVDLRISAWSGKVSVIEINPRYWSSVLGSHAAGVDFPRLACMNALGIAQVAPRARSQRFVQAHSALRFNAAMLLRARFGELLGFHETIWPYLIADPLPHALGRLGPARPMPEKPAAVPKFRKAA